MTPVCTSCTALMAILALSASTIQTVAFLPTLHQPTCSKTQLEAGGGGFGASPKKKGTGKKKVKRSEAKKAQEQLMEQYGGDIARGTEERINKAMSELPEYLRVAAELYKKTEQWDATMNSMSELAKASVPQQNINGAKRAKAELEAIYQEHGGLDRNEMQKLFQKLTWDASADAKAVRSTIGKMSAEIQGRVDKACGFVADAVMAAGGTKGRCLDVASGPGILVPHLTNMGVLPAQITGIDLSPEMIKNAKKYHRGVRFLAQDFFEFEDKEGFDGIIFCSALHDMPDPVVALQKAESLLRLGGKLVVLHAQGASHVIQQAKANPVMVRRGLPDAKELVELGLGLELIHAPGEAGSEKEAAEGYLFVMSK